MIRKKRGKYKTTKIPMGHVTIRLSQDVIDYYKSFPDYTGKIRRVLVTYAAQNDAPVYKNTKS
jgi:uncharacterized protein (DUF4415 family)